MSEQERVTLLLIMYLIASAVTLVALALGLWADAKRRAAEIRSIEWKQMYCREKERSEKLNAENSILRLNAKLPCVNIGKSFEGRLRL